MPRVRERTTTREKKSDSEINEAIRRIEEEKLSYTDVSIEMGIPKSSLARYIKQHRENPARTSYGQFNEHRKVFTNQEEVLLAQYIRTRCKMCYGMSCSEVRLLVYEFGRINNKTMLPSWHKEKLAGYLLLYSSLTSEISLY